MIYIWAATSASSSAGAAAGAVIAVGVIGLALIVLYFVALVSIITKAGYSGVWVLILFVPVVAWAITSLVVYNQSKNLAYYQTFQWNTYVWAWVVDAIAYLIPVIFFFVFAFSEWPVLKSLRALQRAGVLMPPHAGAQSAGFLEGPGLYPTSFGPATRAPSAAPASPTPSPPTGAARFCTNCGESNFANAEFCGSCGNRLET